MATATCAAIDLGASNGRVVVAETDGERLWLRETARWDTPVRHDDGGYECSRRRNQEITARIEHEVLRAGIVARAPIELQSYRRTPAVDITACQCV